MLDHKRVDAPEIFAGTMQLQPVDEDSECGAIAALGSSARDDGAICWVARDAVTAQPRAYVALLTSGSSTRIASVPGIVGDAEDARIAADVIRRYAAEALGLTV